MWRLRSASWVRILGDVEGWVALACTVAVLTAQTTVADRFKVGWLWLFLWAFGIGTGIGGMRFGGPVGRIVGGLATVLLGACLIALVVANLVRGSV